MKRWRSKQGKYNQEKNEEVTKKQKKASDKINKHTNSAKMYSF